MVVCEPSACLTVANFHYVELGAKTMEHAAQEMNPPKFVRDLRVMEHINYNSLNDPKFRYLVGSLSSSPLHELDSVIAFLRVSGNQSTN